MSHLPGEAKTSQRKYGLYEARKKWSHICDHRCITVKNTLGASVVDLFCGIHNAGIESTYVVVLCP